MEFFKKSRHEMEFDYCEKYVYRSEFYIFRRREYLFLTKKQTMNGMCSMKIDEGDVLVERNFYVRIDRYNSDDHRRKNVEVIKSWAKGRTILLASRQEGLCVVRFLHFVQKFPDDNIHFYHIQSIFVFFSDTMYIKLFATIFLLNHHFLLVLIRILQLSCLLEIFIKLQSHNLCSLDLIAWRIRFLETFFIKFLVCIEIYIEIIFLVNRHQR